MDISIDDVENFVRQHGDELGRRMGLCVGKNDCGAECRRGCASLYVQRNLKDGCRSRRRLFAAAKRALFAFAPGRRFCAALEWWRGYRPYSPLLRACPYDARHLLEHTDEIRQVYDLLDEDLSRKIFLCMLMQRLTFNLDYSMAQFCDRGERQYYTAGIPLSKDDVVVDCGAFTGDTFLQFVQRYGGAKRYYLYECDGRNLEKLGEAVRGSTCPEVAVVRPVGVYSENARLSFHADQGWSSAVTSGPASGGIDVVRLDDDIPERDVGFIKMDVEGCELDALKGAEDILRTCKPKLAICIYHRPEDCLTIPLYLHRICPEYRHFRIRHHMPAVEGETVLYVY